MERIEPPEHGIRSDTIAAIATAAGRGGIGIVRVSGDAATAICEQICGRCPAPRDASLARFKSAGGDTIDSGIALYFDAPRSYTGEDVLELHGHGGVVVMQLLLQRALECGARRAEPGEFTLRAFLNHKMDLTQAEAVADLIDASSQQAAQAAQRSLSGDFSRWVDSISSDLNGLRVQIEAQLDFPEEEVTAELEDALEGRARALVERIDRCITAASAGRRLNDAVNVVIAGPPNVGKSSLLNALLGTPRAIVTARPGTTRDVILQQATIQGLHLQLCDTAGLRSSDDEVELAGIALTYEQLAKADIAMLVRDASEPMQIDIAARKRVMESLPAQAEVLQVVNKIDRCAAPPGEHHGAVHVSAVTGAGLEALELALARLALERVPEGEFTARARHVDGLNAARVCVADAQRVLCQGDGLELVAEELRAAQEHLGALTGRVTSDDLLGQIFASFCIGK